METVVLQLSIGVLIGLGIYLTLVVREEAKYLVRLNKEHVERLQDKIAEKIGVIESLTRIIESRDLRIEILNKQLTHQEKERRETLLGLRQIVKRLEEESGEEAE